MKETTIKIVAIGKEGKVYSLGKIVATEKENLLTDKMEKDFYGTTKAGGVDFHSSYHFSGELHWISNKGRVKIPIRQDQPIEGFKGIAIIDHLALGLGSLPNVFEEYEVKSYNGVFCIDLREYENKPFNMTVVILTKDSLPSLLTVFQNLTNRQIFVYPDYEPMIAVVIGNGVKNTKT